MAVKKKPGTALVEWDKELAEAAAMDSKAAEPTGGKFLSIKGGQLSFNGEDIEDNKMKVVIMDFCYENAFYEDKFDPENPASPTCFAFNRDEGELSPREAASKPVNDTCAGCPNNEYGSADTGRGKACKNQIRLALIPASDSADEIEKSEVAYLRIPPTSKKSWDEYFNKYCAKHPGGVKPTCFFETEIEVSTKKGETFARVAFNNEGNFKDMSNGAELWQAVKAKRKTMGDDIMFDYAKPSEEEKKPVRKTAAKFKRK